MRAEVRCVYKDEESLNFYKSISSWRQSVL